MPRRFVLEPSPPRTSGVAMSAPLVVPRLAARTASVVLFLAPTLALLTPTLAFDRSNAAALEVAQQKAPSEPQAEGRPEPRKPDAKRGPGPLAKPDAAKTGATKTGALKTGAGKAAAGKSSPTEPARREAEVLEFVGRHHPELAALLTHLKESDRVEYQKALRDLHRAGERLEGLRSRDVARYEVELKQWQNQSRLDLLVARLEMGPTEELREQLRALLVERQQLKERWLQLERSRVAERLVKVEEQLELIERRRDALIDEQLQTLLRARAIKPNRAKAGKEPDRKTAGSPATSGAAAEGPSSNGSKNSGERKARRDDSPAPSAPDRTAPD